MWVLSMLRMPDSGMSEFGVNGIGSLSPIFSMEIGIGLFGFHG